MVGNQARKPHDAISRRVTQPNPDHTLDPRNHKQIQLSSHKACKFWSSLLCNNNQDTRRADFFIHRLSVINKHAFSTWYMQALC